MERAGLAAGGEALDGRRIPTGRFLPRAVSALWLQLPAHGTPVSLTESRGRHGIPRTGRKKLTEIAQTAPETVILAEDEASVYLQATTCAVWAPKGRTPVVKVHPGRDLTHFYGTLNLLTGEEVAQTRAGRARGVNGQSAAPNGVFTHRSA